VSLAAEKAAMLPSTLNTPPAQVAEAMPQAMIMAASP
jgi:hypothetical protein